MADIPSGHTGLILSGVDLVLSFSALSAGSSMQGRGYGEGRTCGRTTWA